MSGYSPIYNKVNDILQQQQQQQQSYSDLNMLQQQQQSYSELARQVAMLPQHCYPDSGLCLLSQIISLETVSPHSETQTQLAPNPQKSAVLLVVHKIY